MNKHLKNIITILILLIMCMFTLSGCFSSQNINTLAYVIAIGLDVGETNDLKLTLQISKNSGSSGGSASNSEQSSDSVVSSVECSSIDIGLSLFNTYLGKEVNLSHCRMIIFSEELASLGISKYLYTLKNNIQIHSDTNILVSKCTAEDFLKKSNPILETVSAKYYDNALNASQYTGYTDNINLATFFSDYTDTFQEATAILGGITVGNNLIDIDNISSYSEASHSTDISNIDSLYVSGEVPIGSESDIELLGLAVFKSDKLVGELNAIETICHMIVTNKLNMCTIQIPSPISIDEYLDLNVRLVTKPNIDVYLINNSPYIKLSIKLNVRLLSIAEDANDLTSSNIEEIESYIDKYFEENIKNYLYKISKQFNSDIAGFGKYVVSKFLTSDDWITYDWQNQFKDAFFDVTIDSNLRSGYLLLNS